jgi:CRISPR/Cas system CMR-associated protein Cmr5 small subunit
MERIDLDYIQARECQDFICNDLYTFLTDRLQNELGRIRGYIDKYDNQWDRLTVNVEALKEAENIISTKLIKIKELNF